MALQKAKLLPSGAQGNYWKITEAKCDAQSLVCTWIITLFYDKPHADAVPAYSLGYRFPHEESITRQEKAGDLFALGYVKIKAAGYADLDGAIDV